MLLKMDKVLLQKPVGRIFCFLLITNTLLSVNGFKQRTGGTNSCILKIDNTTVYKAIGDTWSSSNPCVKFVCDQGPEGELQTKELKEYCYIKCENEFEMVVPDGQCCGQCIKRKCKYYNKYYDTGMTWKSIDKCSIHECIELNGYTEVTSYTKSCGKLNNCSSEQIVKDNCGCDYCQDIPNSKRTNSNYNPNDAVNDNNDEFTTMDTYKNHSCIRACQDGSPPMTCKYTFVVEWYETLSKACYNCPFNASDCFRPHCIVGDGTSRSVLVINRMMPGPQIEVCVGDKIIVDLKNHLLGEGTTIHWHGLHQRETPYMDGVPFISQCPIPTGSLFRYEFTADNAGTHFWHSHIGMQRSDGAFGPLIVKKAITKDYHSKLYDVDKSGEHTIIVQDWVHTTGVSKFSSHHHSTGNNKPSSILINGKGRYYDVGEQRHPITTSTTAAANEMTTEFEENTTDFSIYDETTIVEVEITEKTAIPTSPPDTTEMPVDVGMVHDNTDSNMKIIYENVDSTTVIDKTTQQQSNPSVQYVFSNRERRDKRSVSATVKSKLMPLHIFEVVKGKRFRFRLINAEFLNCPMEFSIDSHTITVIATDGYDVKPVEVSSFVNYAGERFDFVVNANQTIGNYWVRLKGLLDCGQIFNQVFQVAILRYEGAPIEEPTAILHYDDVREGIQLNALNKRSGLNDSITISELNTIYPDDLNILKEKPDLKFYIYYDFYGKDNPRFHVPNLYGFKQIHSDKGRIFTPQLNHISMKMPSIPLMPNKNILNDNMFCNSSTLINKGINCKDEFCQCTHVLQIPLGSVVELVLVDEGFTFDANHPFHLHGNSFRVIGMDRLNKSISVDEVQKLDELGKLKRNLRGAPIKDTVTIPDGGYTIIRFIADNPGYWLFHCHLEFHVEIGMALVFKVGQHSEMKSTPTNFPKCMDYVPNGFTESNGCSLQFFFPLWFLTFLYYIL